LDKTLSVLSGAIWYCSRTRIFSVVFMWSFRQISVVVTGKNIRKIKSYPMPYIAVRRLTDTKEVAHAHDFKRSFIRPDGPRHAGIIPGPGALYAPAGSDPRLRPVPLNHL